MEVDELLRHLAASLAGQPRPRLKTRLTHAKQVGWVKGRTLILLCVLLCALLLTAILAGCAAPDGAAAPEAAATAELAAAELAATTGESSDADATATPVAAPAAAVTETDAGAQQTQPVEGAAAGPAVDAASSNGASSDGASSAGAVPETAALALAAPSELLDSYRLAASFVITSVLPDGATDVAGTQVQGAWLRTDGPFGFDAAFTLVNSSGERREELDVVAIDDDAAVQTGGAWSTIRRDSALPYTDPDRLLSLPFVTRINRGENLGREQMEGVEVTHYRLTDPTVFAVAVQDILPPGAGTVQSVLLEGWVADAGFVVRYFLQATMAGAEFVDEGGSRLAVQQQIDASYVLSDLDAVPAIEWPADAQPPETIAVPGFVPNTFPVPEGATATPHLGLVEIRTPQTEPEVTAFYRGRLAELGWSVAGELGFYTAAKEGQTISLTILPDEASGETVVRVFAGAGE